MPLAFFDDYQKKLSERILSSAQQAMPELPSTGETLSGEELQALIRSLVGQQKVLKSAKNWKAIDSAWRRKKPVKCYLYWPSEGGG